MHAYAHKKPENQNQSGDSHLSRDKKNAQAPFPFQDNRPEALAHRKWQEAANHSPQAQLNNSLINLKKIIAFPKHRQNAVAQRKIWIGDRSEKHYDDTLVGQQYTETKSYLQQWNQLATVIGTAEKAKLYLTNDLENDVRALLRKYNEQKSFENDAELTRQLVQDIKLKLLGMGNIVGIENQDGQFSQKEDIASVGRMGKEKNLRVYRTMKAEHWNKYVASKDPKEILWGHGGSLGQALHYFSKSKKAKLDDVLVEFAFSQKANALVDYTAIKMGGEGKGPSGGKLTGKSEKNDIMALDQSIFSINLSKSKELISKLNPTITLIDQVLP